MNMENSSLMSSPSCCPEQCDVQSTVHNIQISPQAKQLQAFMLHFSTHTSTY